MKKLLSLFALCALVFAACEPIESGEDNAAITITSKTEVSIGSGNTMGIITYDIVNPVAGATVEVVSEVDWVNSFDYSKMGRIGYKVDANPTYDERSTTVTVNYNGQKAATITFNQEGKPRPNEINVEAPYLLGHYYGDYAGYNYNYYLVFSESNYDANGSFYAAGYKYFLDIYAEERPEDYSNIRVPNGTYTFNLNNDGQAGTFLESFSIYKEYDVNGYEVGEHAFSEGVLTVEDDYIKLEVVFADAPDIHIVTYEGPYSLMDMRSAAGGIY